MLVHYDWVSIDEWRMGKIGTIVVGAVASVNQN